MKGVFRIIACLFLLGCGLSSCVSVANYQKMHLNDKEMTLGDKKLESFEINFQSYREGAAGANGLAIWGRSS